jgi:hypothetical protein
MLQRSRTYRKFLMQFATRVTTPYSVWCYNKVYLQRKRLVIIRFSRSTWAGYGLSPAERPLKTVCPCRVVVLRNTYRPVTKQGVKCQTEPRRDVQRDPEMTKVLFRRSKPKKRSLEVEKPGITKRGLLLQLARNSGFFWATGWLRKAIYHGV